MAEGVPKLASLELDIERISSNVTDRHESSNHREVARDQAADDQRESAVRLEGIIGSAREIMRKDAGLSSDLDRVPQLAWLLFLKLFDAIEEAEEARDPEFRRSIGGIYRWKYWVGNAKTQRGERLLSFVNDDLLPHLRNLSGPTPDDPRTILASIFAEAQNRMLSGNLLRDLALKIDEIDFTSSRNLHIMAFIYERVLKDVC
jgi:type I restriction enzyme M protein